MAERMGFEPMVRFRESLVFKTSSINHSDTSPQWLPPECVYYYTKTQRGCQPLCVIFLKLFSGLAFLRGSVKYYSSQGVKPFLPST